MRNGLEPHRHRTGRQHHVLGLQSLFRAVRPGHEHPVSGQQTPMPLNAGHAVRPEQGGDPARHGLDHGCPALLHDGEVQRQIADLDALHLELVLGALKQLRGLEQGFRGDASGVQAGSAERETAVGVLPFVDAGDLELVLRGANRGGIARGTAADHDHIVDLAHTPSTMRAGSSRHCLTVTKNCTASRPSMMR